jgi:hypothetical protein
MPVWEVLFCSDVLRVERQRNDRGWIVCAEFLRESAIDLAFVPDPGHVWSADDPDLMDGGGFFMSGPWKTPRAGCI